MRKVVLLIGLALITLLTGCASVLNPYKSDFHCPETDKGKCVSVQNAYLESIQQNYKEEDEEKSEKLKDVDYSVPKEDDGKRVQKQNNVYQEALYRELAGLLNEPLSPMVAPPVVMRVLLLPYKGDTNELYMLRYVYFFVDGPKWILGDYLSGVGNE